MVLKTISENNVCQKMIKNLYLESGKAKSHNNSNEKVDISTLLLISIIIIIIIYYLFTMIIFSLLLL